MPTSHLRQLSAIVEAIDVINPQSVLDVGVGFGKYGVLTREYLELRDGRSRYDDWQRRIDGVEIFPGYLTALHRFVYDEVFVGDALDVLPALSTRYDLVLLIDVLEHFTKADGAVLLERARQRGRNVIVSTPRAFIEQGSAFDNPNEQHLSLWTRRELARQAPSVCLPDDISLVCVFGPDREAVRRTMLSPRRRLKAMFPFLRHPARWTKRITRQRM